jgi:hypothetical protein
LAQSPKVFPLPFVGHPKKCETLSIPPFGGVGGLAHHQDPAHSQKRSGAFGHYRRRTKRSSDNRVELTPTSYGFGFCATCHDLNSIGGTEVIHCVDQKRGALFNRIQQDKAKIGSSLDQYKSWNSCPRT